VPAAPLSSSTESRSPPGGGPRSPRQLNTEKLGAPGLDFQTWETTNLDRQAGRSDFLGKEKPPARPERSGRTAGTRMNRRSNARRAHCLGRLAAALLVAAQAVDLRSVPDALAVGAAILPFFGGWAGTGRIRAFLRLSHNPPSPVQSAPCRSRALVGTMPESMQRIVAQTHLRARAKSAGKLLRPWKTDRTRAQNGWTRGHARANPVFPGGFASRPCAWDVLPVSTRQREKGRAARPRNSATAKRGAASSNSGTASAPYSPASRKSRRPFFNLDRSVYLCDKGAGSLCIASVKNLPSGVSSYVSHEEIMLGPHSGSKHHTTQLMPLDSR